ncbi:hypothetical protein HK097_010354 [Rhizophlyctis rosea]|uniref:TPR-like protein n=1 Tax=Rhizophlyctis rosea TaxID=64517 RepID=A0AAD5SA08_9FUNG|nr:hypothetical protein HK097_010354 [Rhizophlyctis rosea]
MSNPPRPGASNGVYIPPRRNAPPRPTPSGAPMPGGPPVAPPRTVYPGPGAPPNTPYTQPHSAQYTQSPAPYGNSAPYHQPQHGYSSHAGGYTQPMGGYVQPGTYGGAYMQPGATPGGYVQPGIPMRPTNTPAPRVASLIPTSSYPNEYFPPQPSTPVAQPNHNVWMHPNQPLHESFPSGDPPARRRPSSIADASALYSYPEQQPPRPTSFDETRPFLENHVGDTRTTGPTIPKRLGSNVPITVDDLLDAGGTAFAAPRHNVEEALAKWRQARNLAIEKGDLIREAKALSNIGAALRVQGRLNESLNELRTAWDVTTRYVQSVSGRSSSLWLQLVMRHADIDSDTEGAAEVINYAAVNGDKGGMDIASGPPIVVWYLQLTTNLGNGHFSLGQFQEAIQYYDMCRRMAEAVMEEYPLPASCPTPALSRNISGASAGSVKVGTPGTPKDDKEDPFGTATPSSPSPRIKLSYLHRQTLLAHARALSHLGLCHQQLGLDEEALDNNLKAESLVTFYSNRAQLSQSFQTRRSSLSHPYSQHLEVQAAEAAIIANVGTSYHAKGRLPTALQYHERSLKLFRNLPDEHGIAKQSINVGCLYMEVGKTLNTLHWIRDMDVASNHGVGGGDAELEACKRYWGPPRLDGVNIGEGAADEGAPEVAGKGMFDMGMVALYEEERVFRIHSDWTGLMCVWLNLGMFSFQSRCMHDAKDS